MWICSITVEPKKTPRNRSLIRVLALMFVGVIPIPATGQADTPGGEAITGVASLPIGAADVYITWAAEPAWFRVHNLGPSIVELVRGTADCLESISVPVGSTVFVLSKAPLRARLPARSRTSAALWYQRLKSADGSLPAKNRLTPPVSAPPLRPARDFWDYLSQVAAPIGTLVALLAAVVTLTWSVRNWKWTFFTKEWSTLMQFIQPQARFMDPELTSSYKTAFKGEDLMKYELIARLCIGYLDDIYFLRSKNKLRTWFRGSVKLFAGTHREWLKDHRDSYDQGFYDFITAELAR
jgi:hypothetical protein